MEPYDLSQACRFQVILREVLYWNQWRYMYMHLPTKMFDKNNHTGSQERSQGRKKMQLLVHSHLSHLEHNYICTVSLTNSWSVHACGCGKMALTTITVVAWVYVYLALVAVVFNNFNKHLVNLQVITLLLCGATQCDNVEVFVNQITKMDVEDQFSFKFLIESVLTDMEQGSLTADSFATILSKKGGCTVNCT